MKRHSTVTYGLAMVDNEDSTAYDAAALGRLLAEGHIRDVLGRYCRAIDRVDAVLLRNCYHDDATDEHGSFRGTAAEYVEWVMKLLTKYDGTTHMLAQSVFDWPTSTARDEVHPGPLPSNVRVETYGTSTHWSASGAPSANLVTGFRYIDDFVLRDGQWKIGRRIAIGEWSRRCDPDTWWEIPDLHRRGARGRDDAVYSR